MKPPSNRRTNGNQEEKGPLRKETEKQGGECPVGGTQGGDRAAMSENAGRGEEEEREASVQLLLISNHTT